MARTRVPFTKGQGTGNDFIILDDPEARLELRPDQVAALCDRRFGIGADGLLRVVRSAALGEDRDTGAAEWFMDYRNADGSIAEMCGNGIRVFARFLVDRGLAPADTVLPIATRAGIRTVTGVGDQWEVDLGPWLIDRTEVLVRVDGLDVPRPGLHVDVGNPHVVVALASEDDLARIDLTARPVLAPEPVAGANVEFVVPGDPLVVEGVGQIRMRVYERGVGETLSCGTGVAATALAVQDWASPAAPDRWRVRVPGGELGVRITRETDPPRVLLSGPAELVFSGEAELPG